MQQRVTKGNVFEDLGFSDEEAAAFAMRVDLAIEIEKFIKRNKLTQTKAADFFGVPQPKISKIVRGKLSEFSIDYLVRMVARTGKSLRVSFARKRAARTMRGSPKSKGATNRATCS